MTAEDAECLEAMGYLSPDGYVTPEGIKALVEHIRAMDRGARSERVRVMQSRGGRVAILEV